MIVHVLCAVAVALAGTVLFMLWYDGLPRRKLRRDEIEAFLGRMRAARPESRPEDLERFRRFQALAESDDGREFYMVNLIRYRKVQAAAKGGVPRSHADYMRAWGKVALPRASHLIYRGKPAIKLFGRPDEQDWDGIALMRYRSRRDLLAIVTDPVFSRDAALKNVAVEYTDVYPSSVGYIVASPRLLLFLVLLPFAMAASELLFRAGRA